MKDTASDRTIVMTRIMPAPLDAVWDAWTDPAKLPQWWGPRGFTCRTHEINLTEGGQWRFDMIGPDGTVYPNRHQFRRIAPKHSIDYHLDDDGTGDHTFDAEVRFSEVKDGTRVSLTLIFATAEERAGVEAFGAVALGYTTLDCLAETAAPDTLSLTRILNATPDRLWQCWTDPSEMAHWFYPDSTDIVSADFAPLTRTNWRTIMQGADSTKMTMEGKFETVDAPRYLVFTHGWRDADGKVPTVTRVTVSLHPLGDQTRLTIVQQGFASDASRDGHRTGWAQTLDHLATHLAG